MLLDESFAAYGMRLLSVKHYLKVAGVDTFEKLQACIALNGLKEGKLKEFEISCMDRHEDTPEMFWETMVEDLYTEDRASAMN